MIVLDKLQNTENLSPNEITVANYLIQYEFKETELNENWKLIVPKNLKSRINGGY